MSIEAEQLYEAVLTDSKSVQNAEAATTDFALRSKLVVHALQGHLKQRLVLWPGHQMSYETKAQDDRRLVNFAVGNADFTCVKSELFAINFERDAAPGDIFWIRKELREEVICSVFFL